MAKLKKKALLRLREEGKDVDFDKKTLAIHASANVRAFVNGDKTVALDALLRDITQTLAHKQAAPARPQPEDNFDKPLHIDDIPGTP